uniref:hypothetical protein n=1 Tax=Nonomuraea bangladeshensis TaxID=404385 RepID=UPI003F497E14
MISPGSRLDVKDDRLAAREDIVLGVDTHKAVHMAAVVSGIGVLLGHRADRMARRTASSAAIAVAVA